MSAEVTPLSALRFDQPLGPDRLSVARVPAGTPPVDLAELERCLDEEGWV